MVTVTLCDGLVSRRPRYTFPCPFLISMAKLIEITMIIFKTNTGKLHFNDQLNYTQKRAAGKKFCFQFIKNVLLLMKR